MKKTRSLITALLAIPFALIIHAAESSTPETDLYIHDLSGKDGFGGDLATQLVQGLSLIDRVVVVDGEGTYYVTEKMLDGKIVVEQSEKISHPVDKPETAGFDERQYSIWHKLQYVSNSLIEDRNLDKSNYVIYIGHGSSCTGKLSSANGFSLDPVRLKNEGNWDSVTGALFFGCSVTDIGDFGFQNSIDDGSSACDSYGNRGEEGNYCKAYYDTIGSPCSNGNERPDPGLKWVETAKFYDISYILGFNFKAPLISQGGDLFLVSFANNWINNTINSTGSEPDDGFFLSWTAPLSVGSHHLIERSYIRKEEKGDFRYAIGKANPSGSQNLRWDWPRQVDGRSVSGSNNVFGQELFKKSDFEVPFATNKEIYELKLRDYECFPGAFERNSAWFVLSAMRLCARGSINRNYVLGLTDGTGNTTPITRYEFLKRTLLAKETNNDFNNIYSEYVFSDLTSDQQKFASYARKLGYVEGWDDGKGGREFRPDELVSRAAAAKMLVEIFQPRGVTGKGCVSSSSDLVPGEWYENYFNTACNKGWFKGYSDGTYKPEIGLNRAEMVTIIDRAVQN